MSKTNRSLFFNHKNLYYIEIDFEIIVFHELQKHFNILFFGQLRLVIPRDQLFPIRLCNRSINFQLHKKVQHDFHTRWFVRILKRFVSVKNIFGYWILNLCFIIFWIRHQISIIFIIMIVNYTNIRILIEYKTTLGANETLHLYKGSILSCFLGSKNINTPFYELALNYFITYVSIVFY